MKRILFLFSLFASLAVSAQVDSLPPVQIDSSALPVTVKLTKAEHRHVLSCLGVKNINTAERINYLNDLRAAWSAASDTTSITVTEPASLIRDAFYLASLLPEGQVVNWNSDISAKLLTQGAVLQNSWLVRELSAIRAANWQVTEGRHAEAEEFLMKINP